MLELEENIKILNDLKTKLLEIKDSIKIDRLKEEVSNLEKETMKQDFWNSVDNEAGTPVEERKPIKIFLHSPGGFLTSTFTMIDAIKMSKTPVYTIAMGETYSGGFFTFLAGHKKFAYPHASFLYHEGATANGGDANKFRNFAKFYEVQLEQLRQVVLDNSSISEEEYDKHIKDDWWLTAEEAVEYGIADEILTEFI